MILVTGSNGKIGSSVIELLVKENNNFIRTIRSEHYQIIDNSCIGLDLLNKNHVKKLFNSFNFKHLIHLAVTRNPLHIKDIRNFSTLERDTSMMLNLLEFCHNLKSIVFTSSASIYELPDVNDSVRREKIAKEISKFLKKRNKKKIKIATISNRKRTNLKINPIFHQNSNKRLNASNKLINELLLISFCFEKKIPLYILRPFYIIETLKEKRILKNKLKLAQKNQN